jgi:hypothetical protein
MKDYAQRMKNYLALWIVEHGDKVVAQNSISILGFDVLLCCVDNDLIKEVTPNEIGLDSRYYRISEKGKEHVQNS